MNEKIKNLIKELMTICNEENIGLAVTALNEQGEIIKAEAGPAKLVITGVFEQYKWAQDELAKTTCHTFVVDNKEDLADVMTRIIKGEFE